MSTTGMRDRGGISVTAPNREWKVLVVDDNPGDRRLYRIYLEDSTDQRYQIWEAETAEQALELCKTIKPDCVLLDYGLPQMTGLEMLQQIGAERGDLPFAVLMLTGHSDRQTVAETLRHGAHDYLLKSITTAPYLERAVQNAIQKFELEQQRKEAEQALRQSEKRFRNAFVNAAIGMCVTDIEGKVIEVNDAYCEITGYPAEELIGRKLDDLTHPDDFNKNLEQYRQLLSGETASYVLEKRYVRKSGEVVWVRSSRSVVKNRQGFPVQTIALSEDITARHHLEEQLRQAQKMEAVGRLAAGVAHDFNNLLTVVIGYADLAAAQLPEDAELRGEIEEIRHAGERGASLIGQLLAFSRQQLMRPEVVELNNVVRGLEKLMRRLIGEDIEMKVHLSSAVGRVKTDRTQIEHVLMNLAANARDAMPNGGRLTIETEPVKLSETIAGGPDLPPGQYVMLTVSDTGHGMSAETLTHIFEPFFTTKGRGQGTGLGLATVYGSVKQSGGTVIAESELNRGSTFRIYLPETEHEVEFSAEEPKSVIPHRRAATILLVEDDPAVRLFLKGILNDEGFTVLESDTAAEGLRLARSCTFQLLLTDVVLPDLSGPELVSRILAEIPDARVLYMSGYTDHALFRQNAVLDGASFLQKPFTRTAVLEKIGEILATA